MALLAQLAEALELIAGRIVFYREEDGRTVAAAIAALRAAEKADEDPEPTQAPAGSVDAADPLAPPPGHDYRTDPF